MPSAANVVLDARAPSCEKNRSRDVGGIVLGIESTAHTFSIGWVDGLGVPGKSISAFVRPVKGGIHPREAADHHAERAGGILRTLLDEEVKVDEIKAVSYSQGPGLGPCLRIGASVARSLATQLNVPLVGVNHCVVRSL